MQTHKKGLMMEEISVIGAGFVGSAHAIFLSKHYKTVNLIDKNESLINKLQSGILDFDSSDARLKKEFHSGLYNNIILPSNNISKIKSSKIIFISIGFDFVEDDNGFENLTKLFEDIIKFCNKNCLLVLETTVPPGTSEKVIIPILNQNANEKNINYVYSYERVMPGSNYLKSIEELPKVYSGINKQSIKIYNGHLERVGSNLKHTLLKNIISAETSKVFENTYRMMNIAIIQEFTEFASKVGVDLPTILDSIRVRPTHSNIRYAGMAPGGYCLTKDPSFLKKSSELIKFQFDFPILEATSKIINRQNSFILKYLTEFIELEKNYFFLGLTYLPGIGDFRNSSSMWIYRKLLKYGYNIKPVDSFWNEISQISNNVSIKKENAILATRHPEFTFDYLKKFKLIIDINSNLSYEEKKDLRNHNIVIFQYGEYA